MNVRRGTVFCLAMIILAGFGRVAAAEGDKPSRQALAKMGLGGLVVMSDEEAMSIRGQGFKGHSSVSVFGNSFATIETKNGAAHSENGYAVSGKHFAKGANGSHAGAIKIKGTVFHHGSVIHIHATKVFAGGFSFGFGF
jgi:hypothetical protein